MSLWLKQSTALSIQMGPFVNNADGFTPETGLTITQADVRIAKNGAGWGQKDSSSSAAHAENGYYIIPLSTVDTDTLGRLRVAVNESGALPVWQDFMVVSAQVWDSFFGADKLQVHVDEMTAGIITAAVIATGAVDADALATDAVTEIQSGLATQASVNTIDDFLDTEIAAILADTNELQTDWVDGGRLDLLVDAIKVKTDNLPTDPADASDIATAFAALPTASEIADAVLDDPITEPGTVFAWGTATLRNIIGWMGLLSRNKMTQDSTETIVRNDADNADLASSQISESSGTFTRGEWT